MSTPASEPSREVQALWDKAEAHLPDFIGLTASQAMAHTRLLRLTLRALAHRQLRRGDLRLDRIDVECNDEAVVVRSWRGEVSGQPLMTPR